MKRILFVALLLIASDILMAQDRYVIFLSDKNNSPYSVSNPQAFLSSRAIARRTAQNIQVTTLDLPVNPSYVSAISGTGAQVLAVSKWFNTVTVRVSSPSVLTSIQNLSFVTGVLNVGRIGTPTVVPSKFDYSFIRSELSNVQRTSQTGSAFNYGTSYDQVHQMKGDMMHDNGYTGTGIHIAVLDAGFDNSNQMAALDSLFSSGRVLSTWDFVDGEQNVFNDGNFHGSMVLSCMAGNLPGELIGTAPQASYHLLRSEYAPSEFLIEEYNWSSAAEYADSAGADIINSSLGYTVFDDPTQNHTYQDLDGNTTPIAIAADIAASRGMIVCNSAGNEGNSSWFRISSPADADSILAVGAVDNMGVIAGFSGRGPSFDGRVKPDVAAMGQGTIVGDPWGLAGTFPGNGTSFASPLMAGMVATLWQCHPNATNMQIINAIKQSASQWSAPDSLMGYGIPDFPMACLLLGGIDSGIDANADQLQLTGPNPFTEALNFSFYSSARQQVEVRLFDLLGRPVYTETRVVNGIAMHDFSITKPLAKGVYVLEVVSEKTSFSLKVVKD